MASHVPKPSHRTIDDMMKDLKVDPLAKFTRSGTGGTVSATERSQSDTRSRASSSGDVKGSVAEGDADFESLEIYRGLPCPYGGYYGFYYPSLVPQTGLDSSVGEAEGQGYYGYGAELQYPVMQGETSSLLYLPVSPIGVDAQYTSQTLLHSSAPMFTAHGYIPSPYGYGDITSPTYLWDPSFLVRDGTFAGTYGYGVAANSPSMRQNMSSSSHKSRHHSKNKTAFSSVNGLPSQGKGHQLKNPYKASQNGSVPQPNIQGKGYIPSMRFPLYNRESGATHYPPEAIGKSADLAATEKAKASNKANGRSISDFANGQAHVTNGGNTPCSLADDGNEKSNMAASSVIRRDQYNFPDFQSKYDEASFFVIKSYSEDDVHKSIKYNVWSSTPSGNKKLDDAYQEAQKKISEQGGKCPVFLFFSVNASGQFGGVAEMIGRVDFKKSMDFWQQDKWTGYFPVKWHIIKDVPNPQLRHIILENNENKPVTNSRDAQEVRLPQGNEILNIFKNYAATTSILDDFDFYESREKVMQQKNMRSPVHNVAQIKAMDISNAKTVESGQGNKEKD